MGQKIIKIRMQIFLRGTETHTIQVESYDQLSKYACDVEQAELPELMFSVGGAPLDFPTLKENQTVDISGKLLGGRVHGSLARAGKVKGQTPKVEKKEKKKKKTGRAMRRLKYNRRFVIEVPMRGGKRRGPNQRPK